MRPKYPNARQHIRVVRSPLHLVRPPGSCVDTTASSSLTRHEVEGLATQFNFADGHAYHDMPAGLQPIMNNLQSIWSEACSKSVPEAEQAFKRVLATGLGSQALLEHPFFSLCPTASNSIDVVAAWLKSKGLRVGLLEPVFDNLALLLRRRGVDIVSVKEADLESPALVETSFVSKQIDCLFIVSPNNPTGFTLTPSQCRSLCELCERNGVVLVTDRTFRFFSENPYDDYGILLASGVTFVTIEDTGKTWPTQDMKVSLMAYSASIAHEIRTIYEEIFLCTSNFTVMLLSNLMARTFELGVGHVVLDEVKRRKQLVRDALKNAPVQILETSGGALLPFAWVDVAGSGMTDLDFVEAFRRESVALLPGRYFYWGSQAESANFVRISLMRPTSVLSAGLAHLSQVAAKVLTATPRLAVSAGS